MVSISTIVQSAVEPMEEMQTGCLAASDCFMSNIPCAEKARAFQLEAEAVAQPGSGEAECGALRI
jgi:hypothetical protein